MVLLSGAHPLFDVADELVHDGAASEDLGIEQPFAEARRYPPPREQYDGVLLIDRVTPPTYLRF